MRETLMMREVLMMPEVPCSGIERDKGERDRNEQTDFFCVFSQHPPIFPRHRPPSSGIPQHPRLDLLLLKCAPAVLLKKLSKNENIEKRLSNIFSKFAVEQQNPTHWLPNPVAVAQNYGTFESP